MKLIIIIIETYKIQQLGKTVIVAMSGTVRRKFSLELELG